MGNFAENLNLGNCFRPPPRLPSYFKPGPHFPVQYLLTLPSLEKGNIHRPRSITDKGAWKMKWGANVGKSGIYDFFKSIWLCWIQKWCIPKIFFTSWPSYLHKNKMAAKITNLGQIKSKIPIISQIFLKFKGKFGVPNPSSTFF